MFDTMTLTKIVGGFCGAFLVFLLGGWVAETIYHPAEAHVAEGEAPHQAYTIAVADSAGAGEAVEEGPPFEELFAAADAAAGEGVFRACASCHALDGQNKVGPHLDGVVNRPVQSVADFAGYSGALIEVADVWTPEHLNGFLENPKGYAPGTSMSYAGVKDAQDRANLIAYLATTGG